MIIDTDVLICFLRGNEKAVNEIINAGSFSVSIITYMELLQGMRNKQEMEQMKKSFDKMGSRVLPINESISFHPADLVEKYTLSSSMELADALIASTCLYYRELLITANDKHYRVVDGLQLSIFRP